MEELEEETDVIPQTVRTSRKRKARGWRWEDRVRTWLNESQAWYCHRLGGSSLDNPDLLAWNNRYSKALVIECKSGSTNYLQVPREQVERILNWTNQLHRVGAGGGYDNCYALLAFRFMSKLRLRTGEEVPRELRDYYKQVSLKLERGQRAPNIVCVYDGTVYANMVKPNTIIQFPDFRMPYQR